MKQFVKNLYWDFYYRRNNVPHPSQVLYIAKMVEGMIVGEEVAKVVKYYAIGFDLNQCAMLTGFTRERVRLLLVTFVRKFR
jgi:hypothetical protein